jgi:CBS domain containing-hemolysin-like protein
MDHLFRFALLFALLGVSAFFSASEVAFFSLTQAQMSMLRESGTRAGRRVVQLLENPGKLLVTIYIGNELVNVSIAAVSTMLALHFLDSELAAVAIGFSAFMVMVFGDISPKSFAFKYAREYALFSSGPLALFARAVYPAQALISWFTGRVLNTESPEGISASSGITEDEFRTMLHRGEDKGILESDEKEMIINVFELGDTKATEIMTPRTEIFALAAQSGISAIIQKARSSNYSRIPVYGKNVDDIVGVLYTKDLIYSDSMASAKLENLMRKPFFIPHTKKVDELLREFRKNKNHMAVILDEYGGVEGLVTLDDILTYVVGDESGAKGFDNFDRVGPDVYSVSGRMSVESFNGRLGSNLSHEDVGTIGGLVFHLFGRVPRWGESIEHEGIKFTVKKLRGTIISELLVEAPEADMRGGKESDGEKP